MKRARLKHGVYQERYLPLCMKCKKRWPDCRHSEPPKRVVLLDGPERVWAQLNGTNYPAVRFRNFNDFASVEMVIPDNTFRQRYTYVGRFITRITHTEVME